MSVQRSESLKQLGFATYAAYLRSPLWRSISRGVLERAMFKCKCCGERATQVHHKAYDVDTLSGRSLGNLVPVCRDCHASAEFDNGRKTDNEEANSRIDKFGRPHRYGFNPGPTVILGWPTVNGFRDKDGRIPGVVWRHLGILRQRDQKAEFLVGIEIGANELAILRGQLSRKPERRPM